MKIAHINMFYLPTFGGVEQVMYELATRQAKQGHEVHVFCCDSDKYSRIKKKEEIIEGVYVHRHRYWFRLSLSTFIWPTLLFNKKLWTENFDIIQTHVAGHAYVLITGIISRFTQAKHLHTTHCSWTDAFRPWILQPFLFLNNLFLNRLAFKLADKITLLSPWEYEFMDKYTTRNKLVIIPNGVDPILYKKVYPNNFKKRLGIKGKIILFFGRLNPTKGPEKLALAGRDLVKKRKDLNFIFIGPDEGKAEEVKEIIKNQPRMRYLGPIRGKEKIAEMYQASDVYVLPSYREGMPLTLIESFASGLPVIASPVNGIPYAMKEPDNGFFVKYGDLENLKKNILKLIDNPKLARKISLNNKKISKDYTWDNIAAKYMEIYKELINAKT